MKKSDLSAVRLPGVLPAVICLFALSTACCRGPKNYIGDWRTTADSTHHLLLQMTETVKVPASHADLRLSFRELGELTPKASFSAQSGQANLRVERQDSIIYITATCDSLQMLVESQREEIYRLERELSEKTEVREKRASWWQRLKNDIFYIALGAITSIVFMYLKKRLWQKNNMTKQ